MAESVTSPAATARPARRGMSRARQEELVAYLFIAPWLIGFVVFTLGAMLFSFGMSLFKVDLLAGTWQLVGAQNYVDLTRDPLFWQSVRVTLLYSALVVPFSTIIALGIALMLNQRLALVGVWRTIYYLPAVVSGVSVALIWNWVLNPQSGLLNQALAVVGIQGPRWFASEQWAVPGLVLMSLWQTGTNMLLYLAGLQGIPTEVQEAAHIDGAGPWRTFFAVTLPLLTPTVFFNVVINIISTFQVFERAYVLTQGGPNNATLTLVMYIYRQSFQLFNFGYASAVAGVLFGMMLLLTLLLFRSSSFWVYYEGRGRS